MRQHKESGIKIAGWSKRRRTETRFVILGRVAFACYSAEHACSYKRVLIYYPFVYCNLYASFSVCLALKAEYLPFANLSMKTKTILVPNKNQQTDSLPHDFYFLCCKHFWQSVIRTYKLKKIYERLTLKISWKLSLQSHITNNHVSIKKVEQFAKNSYFRKVIFFSNIWKRKQTCNNLEIKKIQYFKNVWLVCCVFSLKKK